MLYQPLIPQNTGNVVRTCKVTGCKLVLVKPGFSTSDRMLKRAGLDYWDGVDVQVKEDLEEVLRGHAGPKYFFTSKARQLYSDVQYEEDSMLVFGSETTGLPEDVHERYRESMVTLPMVEGRCLNLATSVGIGVYEAWRQGGFTGRR